MIAIFVGVLILAFLIYIVFPCIIGVINKVCRAYGWRPLQQRLLVRLDMELSMRLFGERSLDAF